MNQVIQAPTTSRAKTYEVYYGSKVLSECKIARFQERSQAMRFKNNLTCNFVYTFMFVISTVVTKKAV